MAIHPKAPLAADERMASTIVCTALAEAAETPVNHGTTADLILSRLTEAGLVQWGSTLDVSSLPAYKPHPTVGDRLALARAERHAVEAERIVRRWDDEPSRSDLSMAEAIAARQASMMAATAEATTAQAWAMIALVYQSPDEETVARGGTGQSIPDADGSPVATPDLAGE